MIDQLGWFFFWDEFSHTITSNLLVVPTPNEFRITPWSSERWVLRVWGTQKIRRVTTASHGDGCVCFFPLCHCHLEGLFWEIFGEQKSAFLVFSSGFSSLAYGVQWVIGCSQEKDLPDERNTRICCRFLQKEWFHFARILTRSSFKSWQKVVEGHHENNFALFSGGWGLFFWS